MKLTFVSLALGLLIAMGAVSHVSAAQDPLDKVPAGMSPKEEAQYKEWAAEQKELQKRQKEIGKKAEDNAKKRAIDRKQGKDGSKGW